LARGATDPGVETETPKGIDWIKNGKCIPPPRLPKALKVAS